MPRKMAIVTLTLEGYFGGLRIIEEDIPRFRAAGWEVHLYVQKVDRPRFERTGAVIHKLSRPWASDLNRIRWFDWRAHRHTRRGFDLVVGHQTTRRQDVLQVNNCWKMEADRTGNAKVLEPPKVQYQFRSLEAGQYTHLVALSKLSVDALERYHGIDPACMRVVYPGVDVETFVPRSDEFRHQVRERLGLPQDKLLVALVTSGNFRKRGLDRLIEALRRLPEAAAQSIGVVVVGNDREVDNYREQTDPLPMDWWYFPSRPDIEELFAAVDIVVLPARIEEFGMVVLEAMACGRPVLVNEWVGASELIPGKWRRFVPADHDDPDKLAADIQELIGSPELRAEFGAEMRQVAEQHTWDHNARENLAVYDETLAQRGK